MTQRDHKPTQIVLQELQRETVITENLFEHQGASPAALRLLASCAQDVGSRGRQEDAMLVSSHAVFEEKGVLAVLADGMGGMQAGDKFSEIATRGMIGHFESAPAEADMRRTLYACYAAAQKEALAAQSENEDDAGGSTVVAVLLREGRCAFLTVGDSRLYLLRGGALIQLNREQILGRMLDERAAMGVIPLEEAVRNTRRGGLVSFLGRESSTLPDLCDRPIDLLPGDKLVLASDGVFGTLEEEELARLCGGAVETASGEVISAVLQKRRPRQDNCSVMIITVRGPDGPAGRPRKKADSTRHAP